MQGHAHQNANILEDVYHQSLLLEVLNTLNAEGYIATAVFCEKQNDNETKYKNLLVQNLRIEEILTTLPKEKYDLLEVAIKCALYSIVRVMQRYNLEFLPARNFYFLKLAIKKELGYRPDRSMDEKGIFGVSDKIDKAYVVDAGKKIGMTPQEVIDILPALTMKMTVSEHKSVRSAFKAGGFFSQREYEAELGAVGERYGRIFK